MKISDFTVACALGRGRAEVSENLVRGIAPGMTELGGDVPGRSIRFGLVPGEMPKVDGAEFGFRSVSLLKLALSLDGFGDAARRLVGLYGAERVAVVIGDSTTGIDEAQSLVDVWLDAAGAGAPASKPDGLKYSMIELGTPADWLKREIGAKGPSFAISTACSSSAKAFASARRLIEGGFADAAVVGGVDSRCRFAMNGFNALGALSAGAARPFAQDRDGINLGEGVALFTLEKGEGALNFIGSGETSDAYHPTAPDPSGAGAEAAMRLALEDAGIKPKDVDYVNFHGTGTIANDDMEERAFKAVFGEFGGLAESTKALTGHCLGAAGAVEAAICLIRILSGGCRCAISNSFAFGGSNACVAFSGVGTASVAPASSQAEDEAATVPRIEDVVPHRGRMLFLDRIESLDFGEETIRTSFTVSASHVLWDGSGVPNWASVEFMAQAAAALAGAADRVRRPGTAARPGLLLGTRTMKMDFDRFVEGKRYFATAKREFGDDDTASFLCRIEDGGKVVAEAILNAYRPPNAVEFLKGLSARSQVTSSK